MSALARSLVLAAVWLLPAFHPAAADPGAIRKSLEAKLPGTPIGEITKTPYAGLYEVVLNRNEIFYTDARGEVAFIGKVVDIATRANLSERRLEELRRVDFGKLPLDLAIVKVKGNGARKMAVFSDPDCPFCKRLEQELERVTDATIYTFLFPIPQLHPDAMRKATLVWCAPDRAQAWDDWMLRGKLPEKGSTSCATPIFEIAALADTLGINATPGIVFSDGRVVSEAIPADDVNARLAAASKS
jgi:thiol:disulfide interchange protein DsbC